MKKILFFALIILATISCKKDNDSSDDPTTPVDPTVDVRDAFVGEYEVTLTGTASLSTSNETISAFLPDSFPVEKLFDEPISLNIEKDPDADNQVIISSGLYNCTALVSGNNLVLESSTDTRNFEIGQIGDYQIGTVPVTYTFVHKVATLNEGVLTWHTDANASTTFSVSILSVDVTADADIENTAVKVK